MRFSVHLCQRKFLNKHLRFSIHVLHTSFIPPLVAKSYAPRFCHVRTSPVSLVQPNETTNRDSTRSTCVLTVLQIETDTSEWTKPCLPQRYGETIIMWTRHGVDKENRGLPSQHECCLFTPHLIGQHKRVIIDCTRSGIEVLFIGHQNCHRCPKG
jgi:hypothetical protein